VTVTDGLRVRSKPRVAGGSVVYEPPLDSGVTLRVLDGPVAGSGYWWYRIWLREGSTLGGGIDEGWVAAFDHDGTPWIGAFTGQTHPEPDRPLVPSPVLAARSSEAYTDASGNSYVRHRLSIVNWEEFPPDMISRAYTGSYPSRTYAYVVDDDTNHVVSAFYDLAEPSDLADFWFVTRAGFAPPRFVRVDLRDIGAGRGGSSNAVQICPDDWGPSCES
jgi:hypothetical protein